MALFMSMGEWDTPTTNDDLVIPTHTDDNHDDHDNATTTLTESTIDTTNTKSKEDSGWEEDDFDPQSLIGTIVEYQDPRTGETACVSLAKLLGSGSFALVYAADTLATTDMILTDANATPTPHNNFKAPITSTPSLLAVKCLFKQGLSAAQLSLQRREAELLLRLAGHEGIVSLHAVSETSSFLFLIMDRCDEDLFDAILTGKICGKGPFYEIEDEMEMCESVKDVFTQMVDAVAFCHSKGVYHRDLKPENMLTLTHPVSGDFVVKLTDFGLATTRRFCHDYGSGSVSYTPPDSLAGPAYDRCHHRNNTPTDTSSDSSSDDSEEDPGFDAAGHDVWSLGVVFFNLLTAKNPWYSATPDDAAYAEFSAWLESVNVFEKSISGGSGTTTTTTVKAPGPSPLRKSFGLSKECDGVFKRVFQPEASHRCSLQDLRGLVERIPRFLDPAMKSAMLQPSKMMVEVRDAAGRVSIVHAYKMGGSRASGARSRARSWSSDLSDMDFANVPAVLQQHSLKIASAAEDSVGAQQQQQIVGSRMEGEVSRKKMSKEGIKLEEDLMDKGVLIVPPPSVTSTVNSSPLRAVASPASPHVPLSVRIAEPVPIFAKPIAACPTINTSATAPQTTSAYHTSRSLPTESFLSSSRSHIFNQDHTVHVENTTSTTKTNKTNKGVYFSNVNSTHVVYPSNNSNRALRHHPRQTAFMEVLGPDAIKSPEMERKNGAKRKSRRRKPHNNNGTKYANGGTSGLGASGTPKKSYARAPVPETELSGIWGDVPASNGYQYQHYNHHHHHGNSNQNSHRYGSSPGSSSPGRSGSPAAFSKRSVGWGETSSHQKQSSPTNAGAITSNSNTSANPQPTAAYFAKNQDYLQSYERSKPRSPLAGPSSAALGGGLKSQLSKPSALRSGGGVDATQLAKALEEVSVSGGLSAYSSSTSSTKSSTKSGASTVLSVNVSPELTHAVIPSPSSGMSVGKGMKYRHPNHPEHQSPPRKSTPTPVIQISAASPSSNHYPPQERRGDRRDRSRSNSSSMIVVPHSSGTSPAPTPTTTTTTTLNTSQQTPLLHHALADVFHSWLSSNPSTPVNTPSHKMSCWDLGSEAEGEADSKEGEGKKEGGGGEEMHAKSAFCALKC
ncbi:hypothetical protein HDV05_006552 [Chytridiales sp. JEL 0842]|nr:hypothetical protein HDV05_006552 [Chytridiales sp. JEL 0842]